jgi:tartrate-resistant acid phosphatase type 5
LAPRSLVLLAVPAVLFAQKDLGRITPAGQPLRVVALGDFGDGSRAQIEVARAMARRHAESPFDLGVTVGDNFYECGVRSVEDPKWKARWEDLYTPLGILFYAALGNHDYGHPSALCPGAGASPRAEIERSEHSKSWRMPALYYTFAAGSARFFAIDTEGWTAAQLEWLTLQLAAHANEPGVSWRIVYGHHPIYTSGEHINERRIGQLRQELLPLLKQAKVDVYLTGHDHDIEHLRADGIDLVICGGGGAHLRSMGRRVPQSVFAVTAHGFAELAFDEHELTLRLLDANLKTLENPPLRRTR